MGGKDEPCVLFHLHLSDSTPVDEEEFALADGKTAKVIWKDVLVEGEYPMSPSATGATNAPMRVIADGESDGATKTISMSDLIESHEAGAFKYVTIPTSHKDGLLENTGYVPRPKGLRVVEKNGNKVMQAALGFTEPEIKGKVKRGTIPDVSAGIYFSWTNKAMKKTFRSAMKHVALTPTPFMGNLEPFPAVFASDDEIPADTKVEVYEFEHDGEESKSEANATVVWNETSSFNYLRQALEVQLRPQEDPTVPDDGRPSIPRPSYYVQDVSTENTALVEEFFKGERRRFVIPFDNSGDEPTLAPSIRWTEVREAMIAASDDFEEMAAAKVKERISFALSEVTNKSATVFRVDDITLDRRVKIINKVQDKTWLAQFAVLDNGSVWLAPTSEWEAIDASDNNEPVVEKKQSFSPSLKVVALSESPETRVAAARQRRRHSVAS